MSMKRAAPQPQGRMAKKHKGSDSKNSSKPSGSASGGKASKAGAHSGHTKAAKANKPAYKIDASVQAAKKTGGKKNYDLIQALVLLWEAARPQQVSAVERTGLIEQILKKADGKYIELANNHTASRIMQFCFKSGKPEQRERIIAQIKANMVAIAKSKYGHHLACKIITMSTKEQLPDIVRMFQGHVVELMRHPQGAEVLDDLYQAAPAALKNQMCAEFYGREFALFGGVQQQGSSLTSLSLLLQGQGAAKRRNVMQHMTKSLVPIMEKALLQPPMVHRLLRDFLENAPPLSVEDAVDTLSATGAALLQMAHTQDGAAVMCMLLGYGSAKDRKRIIKGFKGNVGKLAINEWGYTVLIQASSVADDTSLAGKVICTELKEMMDDAVQDSHAVRVLLHLLSPYNKSYLSKDVLALLQLPQKTVKGSSGKMVTDIDGDEEELQDALRDAVTTGNEDGGDDDDLFQVKGKQPKGGKRKQKPGTKDAQAVGDDGDSDKEADGQDDAQPQGERVLGLSKKDNNTRRRELLSLGGKGKDLATAMTTACAANAGGLLRAKGILPNLIVEVCRGGDDGILQQLAPEGIKAVQDAVVSDAAGETSMETDGGYDGEVGAAAPAAEHIFTHFFASRSLRRILKASADEGDSGGPATQFAEQLWSRACAGKCKTWLDGHGKKILAGLASCGSATVRAAISEELQPLVKPLTVKQWRQQVDVKHQEHASDAKGKEEDQTANTDNKQGSKQGTAQVTTDQDKQSATPKKQEEQAARAGSKRAAGSTQKGGKRSKQAKQ